MDNYDYKEFDFSNQTDYSYFPEFAIENSTPTDIPSWVLIAIHSALFLISALGNTTILFLLLKGYLRCPTHKDTMLLSLILADLLKTVIIFPLEMRTAFSQAWPTTELICQIVIGLQAFCLYLSNFLLVGLAIDRFYAISKPFGSKKRANILIIGAWLLAYSMSFPEACLFGLQSYDTDAFICTVLDKYAALYNILFTVIALSISYLIPLFFIVCFYACIFSKLRSRPLNLRTAAANNSLKLSLTISILCLICWTPNYIVVMLYSFDVSIVYSRNFYSLFHAVHILTCANPALNVFAYMAFNICGRKNYENNAEHTFSLQPLQAGIAQNQADNKYFNRLK